MNSHGGGRIQTEPTHLPSSGHRGGEHEKKEHGTQTQAREQPTTLPMPLHIRCCSGPHRNKHLSNQPGISRPGFPMLGTHPGRFRFRTQSILDS